MSTTIFILEEEQHHHVEIEDQMRPLVTYDPYDKQSIREAQQAIMKRFDLPIAPLLCSPSEPSLASRLSNTLKSYFKRQRSPAAQ